MEGSVGRYGHDHSLPLSLSHRGRACFSLPYEGRELEGGLFCHSGLDPESLFTTFREILNQVQNDNPSTGTE